MHIGPWSTTEITLLVGGVSCLLVLVGLLRALSRKRPTSRRRAVRRPPTNIVLTTHAKERMAQRGVMFDELEAVLTAPQRIRRDERQDSHRLESDFPKGTLKVWVTEWPAPDKVVVKSTAWRLVDTLAIPRKHASRLIADRGAGVRRIEEASGARISVRNDGSVRMTAGDEIALERARQEIGRVVTGRRTPR